MTAAAIRQKVDRGVKRRCAACSTLFYDLMHYPIQCPKCGALFDPKARPKLLPSSPKRVKAAGTRSRSKAAAVPLAEANERKWPNPETEDAEADGQTDQEDAILDREDEDEEGQEQARGGEAEET
jgi:uncharacterized protein (TIGR02300 family)